MFLPQYNLRCADFSFNWTRGQPFHRACQNQNCEIHIYVKKCEYRLLFNFVLIKHFNTKFLFGNLQNKLNKIQVPVSCSFQRRYKSKIHLYMTSHWETNRKINDFTCLPDCLQFKYDIKVLCDCYSSCLCIYALPLPILILH